VSDQQSSGDGPQREQTALRPNLRGRAHLRAAFALEEAGELQEAARLFEYVGEHAQAAALRLEHAQTLRDEDQRLSVLREGAARNRGDTEQGSALHRSLARALLTHIEGMEDNARRRGLLVEAARALEEAGNSNEAGGIYEAMGMLSRASKAYEAAGEINKLELVLEVLERREAAEESLRQLEVDVDVAWQEGKRGLARTLIGEYLRDAERLGRSPQMSLARRLADLDRLVPRGTRIHVEYRSGGEDAALVHVHLRPSLRLGRAPDADIRVSGAALSREHVIIRSESDAEGRPRICAVDQGTPAGTFWEGEALVPGVPHPLTERGQLGLGFATALDIAPIPSGGGVIGALVGGPDRAWELFLPHGGPLLLDPTTLAPAGVEMRGDFVTLVASRRASTWLEDQALGRGAIVELLTHDRLRLESAGEPAFHLEVVG
jgi:tetratricopeptide (TPR) repeat protein